MNHHVKYILMDTKIYYLCLYKMAELFKCILQTSIRCWPWEATDETAVLHFFWHIFQLVSRKKSHQTWEVSCNKLLSVHCWSMHTGKGRGNTNSYQKYMQLLTFRKATHNAMKFNENSKSSHYHCKPLCYAQHEQSVLRKILKVINQQMN